MAFIQCSLIGTALSWYIRLNATNEQDWHAFVQTFKKQLSSQKNAYYAQVETLNLTKKDNKTVRLFALKVQQLGEKGGCNENASTILLKSNEIFTNGLPKNLKDFANKRQVKHTRSRYDNYKRDSRFYRSPYRCSYRSPYRHDSRHRYRSRSYSRDNNNFTRYTSSFRPPSRPGDSISSRSRSHSNTKNKLNTIQQFIHKI